VTVDVFGSLGVISLYNELDTAQESRLFDQLFETGLLEALYVKRRPKAAHQESSQKPDWVAPPLPVRGESLVQCEAREDGVQFEIRPGNGLSVGLYLDSRDARRWVKQNAAGRTVLNLFAYTCGFAVAAKLGHASRAINVDLSRKVLEWGEHNFRLNGLIPTAKDFIAGDVFEWLHRFQKKKERFSLVVVDPPGFSSVGKARFSAAKEYHRLMAAVAPLLEKDAVVLAMCNVEKLSWPDFEQMAKQGLGLANGNGFQRFGASAIDFGQPSALKCLVTSTTPRPMNR
jgi:23S rRNA (cytosine1962-C5)-methyltransferase